MVLLSFFISHHHHKDSPIMELFTLVRVCPCEGNQNIVGVFENMAAVLERLRLFSNYTDVGEEYRIECFEVKTFEEEFASTEKCLEHRAEYKAKQALEDKEAE